MGHLEDKYQDLMRGGFSPGAARGMEVSLPDGGVSREYEHGAIFWSSRTDAHWIERSLLEKYLQLGGTSGELGYPLADTQTSCLSRHSRFERGSLHFDLARKGAEVEFVPDRIPPPDLEPKRFGRWELAPFDSGVVGIHSAAFPANKLLFLSYLEEEGFACQEITTAFADSRIIDLDRAGAALRPAVIGAPPAPMLENLFCSGHAFLADGRLLVAGGEREDVDRVDRGLAPQRPNHTVRAIFTFTPGGASGGIWTHVADCARGRWYPSCATLPDGQVLIFGGTLSQLPTGERIVNPMIETFDPANNAVRIRGYVFEGSFTGWPTYPFLFTVPGNRVFMHYGNRSRILDLASFRLLPDAYDCVMNPGWGRTAGKGTAVLLPLLPDSQPAYRARILLIGGTTPASDAENADQRIPNEASCEILDLSETKPAWRLAATMHSARAMPDATLLPDGTVFVCNGRESGSGHNSRFSVMEAEIYDPASGSWTVTASQTIPRGYHATALLLPDGRVAVAGTDCSWNVRDPGVRSTGKVIEIFSPAYVFAQRPAIGHGVSPKVNPGESLFVPTRDADDIASAALVRCGSVTHSFNSDQRHVGLELLERGTDGIRVAIPSDSSVLPPGPYFLFIRNRKGTPSVGRYVRVSVVLAPLGLPHAAEGPLLSKEQENAKLQKRIEELETDVSMLMGFISQLIKPAGPER